MDYNKQTDYSSLIAYITCPRKFLFRYILHLRSTRANIDLVFGVCWHYGFEVAYNQIMNAQKNNTKLPTSLELTKISYDAFLALWKIEGEPNWPDTDMIFPKSPGHAGNMYAAYWEQYYQMDLENQTVLAVESPFDLALDHIEPDLPHYIGRLDLVYLLPDNQIKIVDHKSAKSVNKTSYTSFFSSLQTDGYLTVGHVYFDKIPTIEYNVALCQKTAIKFERFLVMKRKTALDRFLYELASKAKKIKNDLKRFNNEKSNTTRNFVPTCFERSPGYACTMYFRECEFYDLCTTRNNPLLWHNNPPQGYTIEEWNPAQHEAKIKQSLSQL